MNENLKTILNSNVVAVIVGAILTYTLGISITNQWEEKRERYEERIKFAENFSTLAQKRMYAMLQVYWATHKHEHHARFLNYDEKLKEYSEIKDQWNEELIKNFSLIHILFGEREERKLRNIHHKMLNIHYCLRSIRATNESQFEIIRTHLEKDLKQTADDLQKSISSLFRIAITDKDGFFDHPISNSQIKPMISNKEIIRAEGECTT